MFYGSVCCIPKLQWSLLYSKLIIVDKKEMSSYIHERPGNSRNDQYEEIVLKQNTYNY
jgi:hypothetical protein